MFQPRLRLDVAMRSPKEADDEEEFLMGEGVAEDERREREAEAELEKKVEILERMRGRRGE